MIGVLQTEFGDSGNCLRACIASILELPLSAVPDVPRDTTWFAHHNEWLKTLGLAMIMTNIPLDVRDPEYHHPPKGSVVIMVGESPRFDGLHAVVWKDGRIIWDPYPNSKEGVGTLNLWSGFIALDPSSVLKSELLRITGVSQ